MSGFVYHGALAPLAEAVRHLQGNVQLITGLLDSSGKKNPLLRKTSILFRHIRFMLRVLSGKTAETCLVREFSSVPLLLVFPFIKRRAKHLFFLVNHNLQWTLGSRMEKYAFRALARKGCRFIFFEQVPEKILLAYGLNPAAFRHLSHPVPITPFVRTRDGGVERIGIIGQYRQEKGIDDLLAELEPVAEKYRIVLALPNIAAFRQGSRFSDADWILLEDTVGFEDYRKAIARCDVIIINHPDEGYRYRASGLVADAAAAHVPVVARDLPTIGKQMSDPVCIGEVFREFSDLSECIERVSEKLEQGGFAFPEYEKARSVQAMTRQLSGILA